MCGIAGIYHRDGRPVDSRTLDQMTDALAHRGPDGRGTWIGSGIGLGHRRLSIRDLSDHGAQPFHSRCGRVAVSYNGEIYNDRILAAELERHHGLIRRTTCDTEILPAGWLAWGLGLLDRLEGIYSFALWDEEKKVLVLARDAIGAKPLYFTDNQETLNFASEPKGLLAGAAARPTLSAPDVATLLALGYTDSDRSIMTGIRQVEPGTALIVERAGTRTHRFWSPRRSPKITSLDEGLDRFCALFRNVVSEQLVSDVPVAVLQSGGIDSSLVSLALPKVSDVRLYNVRFAERSHDEAPLAQDLANAAGRQIRFLDLDSTDLQTDFCSVVRAVDGCLADSSALAVYQLSREIRRLATVALSGDGGDEFFGGYHTYRASVIAQTLRLSLPAGAWRHAAEQLFKSDSLSHGRVGPMETLARLFYGLSCPVPHSGWRHYLPSWDRNLVYGPELRALGEWDPLGSYASAFSKASGNVWDRALLADQRYYLPADMLTKVDRTSMAHGLEVRVPLLDRRIMDFAGTLDRRLLISGSTTKVILRRAAERFGAPPSLSRGAKKGFNIPMNQLLLGPLRSLADHLLDGNADLLAPFCAPDGVRRVWRDHRDERVDRKYVIWVLMTLAVYRKELGV